MCPQLSDRLFVRFYERTSGLQVKLKRKGLFGRDICPQNIHMVHKTRAPKGSVIHESFQIARADVTMVVVVDVVVVVLVVVVKPGKQEEIQR